MAIGDIVHNSFESYVDEYTGAVVERLTDPSVTCHHMYFYAHMTTRDGGKLLYAPQIAGERQIYCMDLATGDAVQLTEGPGVDDWGAEFTHDESAVLYHQGDSIWRTTLDGADRARLYTTPAGWQGRDIGLSRDADLLVMVEIKSETMASKIGGANWNFFAQNCLAKPLCRIVCVDLATGESEVVLEERCWLGHPQLRPGDPSTILYCHEGPYDLIDARMWTVRRGEGVARCCREQPDGIIFTHEFWTPDGSRVAYVRRGAGNSDSEDIRLIDPDSMEEEVLMSCRAYAHCICDRGGEFFVGDAQGDPTPIHLQREEDILAREQSGKVLDDFIYLIDVHERKEIPLAYHGSSWSARWGTPQDAHPHPCFTEDGRYVLFVTDRFGHPAIHRVDVKNALRGR